MRNFLIDHYLNEFPLAGILHEKGMYSFTDKQLEDFVNWISSCYQKWDIPQAKREGWKKGFQDGRTDEK